MLYDSLHLIQTTPEQAHNTCGPYWFIVQNHGTAHTAFRRKESFLTWLDERGLSLSEELAPHGTHKVQRIIGQYRTNMHMSYDEFFALKGLRTRTLSNGDYTMAIITNDPDGLKTVHTLNPNCHDRPEYNYQESSAIYG